MFGALLEEEPDSVRVMVSLAQAKARMGRVEDALGLIERAIRISSIYFPAYAVATDVLLESGRKAEAVEYLTKELSIHGKQAARRVLLADLYFEVNNPKAGLDQVRQALVDSPRDEMVLLKMAELQFMSGDVEKSIHYYVKTRRKNPHCTKALDGLAQVCVSIGEPQKAFKMFNDTLKASPQQKDVLLARARLHEKIGEFDPALGDVETYLISEPESVEALLIRGRLLLRLDLSKEAQATWQEIETIAPTADNYAKIGVVCLKMSRYEMARRAYEKATQLDPHAPKYQFSLGYAFENLRLYASAMECYQRVLGLHPGDADAKDALGRVLQKTRKAG
jgi:tetratricopeptide (TPR) repeat protein